MNILAVDTAGKTAGVALMQDGRLLYEVYFDGGLTHSETLLPLIDTCLKLCGLTCADIDLFGVNAGPGSFTGLRIGLAAVKGLAFPRNTPCAPVSTLEALAAGHVGQGTVLCALDARRGQVYSAAFDLATHTRLLDDDARTAGSLADFVKNCKKPLFFVGDGAYLCYNIYSEAEDRSAYSRSARSSFHIGCPNSKIAGCPFQSPSARTALPGASGTGLGPACTRTRNSGPADRS